MSACRSVCLSVCLSECISQETHVQTLSGKFFGKLSMALFSSGSTVIHCASSFVDDVMFVDNDQEQVTQKGCALKITHHGQHRFGVRV